MAKRYGGKYSPDAPAPGSGSASRPAVRKSGGRSNVMFVPAIVLVATTFSDGATGLALGLAGAAALVLGAWLLREGLQAEAAFNARKVARRPAFPRKIFAAVASGIGAGSNGTLTMNGGTLNLFAFGFATPVSQQGAALLLGDERGASTATIF